MLMLQNAEIHAQDELSATHDHIRMIETKLEETQSEKDQTTIAPAAPLIEIIFW